MSTTATQVLAKQSLGNKMVRRGLLYMQDLKAPRKDVEGIQMECACGHKWCYVCRGELGLGADIHAQTTHRIRSPNCRTFSDAIKPTPSINWVRPHVAKGHVAANHLHFVLMQPGAWATLTENKMGCGIILSMS